MITVLPPVLVLARMAESREEIREANAAWLAEERRRRDQQQDDD